MGGGGGEGVCGGGGVVVVGEWWGWCSGGWGVVGRGVVDRYRGRVYWRGMVREGGGGEQRVLWGLSGVFTNACGGG